MSSLQILSNPFISVCLNAFLTVNKGVSGIVLEFFINTLRIFELRTCNYFRFLKKKKVFLATPLGLGHVNFKFNLPGHLHLGDT